MKKIAVVVMTLVFILTVSGMLWAQKAEKAAPPKKAEEKKPEGAVAGLVKATATVEAVNLEKREITLKGPKGAVFTIVAGEEVKNLPQVKAGDKVMVEYYESLAWKVLKKGAAPTGVEETGVVATAEPGQKPGGIAAREVTAVVTVKKVDQKKGTITIKNPRGELVTIKARNPENLKKVKRGDEVEITYTEAFAIKVEAAKSK